MINKNLISLAAGAALLASSAVQAQDWEPSEPVTIIVPWSAGGATDASTRVLAGVLTEAIGQSFVILNQPGAAGSVGTRAVWDAPHDGMTIAAGAAADLGTYPVLGLLDVDIDQWRLYLWLANPSLVSVPADSEWEDFGDLLEALQTAEEPITVSSSGLTGATAITMQAIQEVVDVNFRPIIFEGGNPAIVSTAAGETQFTAQNATEQIDMIRAGRLRPLAVVAADAVELEGFGTVPSILDWMPELSLAPNYFGIFIPADAPQEVLDTLDRVWANEVANADALRNFAAERGSIFNTSFGDEALAAAMPFLSINAWQQFDGGSAPNDPSEHGIPRPGE